MCAINGFTGAPDKETLLRMNQVTSHRGPDGTGVFEAPGISMGHNRLAILDPRPDALQPMSDHSGRYTVVFNGELYNYRELKKEIPYPYRTESDTEVLLAGWAAMGPKILERLSGVFAFGLWDRDTGTLFLARDATGVNPLYYARNGAQIGFSSEVKALLEWGVERTFDPALLKTYLQLLYVPGPETLFTGVKSLAPGTYLTFANGTEVHKRYSKDSRGAYPSALSWSDAVSQVRETVERAVSRQLVSDRPLGVLLSGGIDSTVVLAAATRARGEIDAFSIAWGGLEPGVAERFNADARLAKETAERYGARHHRVDLSPEEVPGLIEDAVWHLDTPISSASFVSQLALARYAKQTVDVVLSGDGGDELFGGYERYRLSLAGTALDAVPAARSLVSRLPRLAKLADAPTAERIARFMFVKEEEIGPLLRAQGPGAHRTIDALLDRMPDAPFTQKMLWLDRESWLVDHSLIRTNKMSMAAGLEQRVPILDDEVRLLAEMLPLSYKVSPFGTKRILKAAFAEDLAPIIREPKRGWFSPGAKWLRNKGVKELAREALSRSYWEGTAECFNFEEIARYQDAHEGKDRYHFTSLWAIMTFQLWAKRYKMHPR